MLGTLLSKGNMLHITSCLFFFKVIYYITILLYVLSYITYYTAFSYLKKIYMEQSNMTLDTFCKSSPFDNNTHTLFKSTYSFQGCREGGWQ